MQHRNLKIRHAALDAVSSFASVHWIADRVRSDALLLKKRLPV